MKKLFLLGLVLLLAFSLALTACGKEKQAAGDEETNQGIDGDNQNQEADGGDQDEVDDSELYMTKGDPNLTADLTIWAITPGDYVDIVPAFNKYYPNVKITFEPMGFDVTAKTITAIAAGSGGPDIVQFHSNWLGDLTGLQAGLENLLDPPYNAGRYENEFSEANWRRYMTIDGKRLLSLPGEYVPSLTIYRQDIMADYGYPSDPEGFGDFIQNEDNYFNMAQTFKADDKWVFPLKGDALLLDYGFFDEDLNYTRNNEDYARLFDITKRANQLGLIANLSVVWDEAANQALAANRLIMNPTTWTTVSFFVDKAAPDTMGKWRITRLPFGEIQAAQGLGMSILSQSKQKEAAWAFIQFCSASIEGQKIFAGDVKMIPFKPAQDEDYLNKSMDYVGDQKPFKLASQILDDVPLKVITPLDAVAKGIWDKGVDEMLEKNTDSHAALQKIEEDTMAAVSVQRDELLKSMGK